jgi:hypothetical protein
MLTSVALAAAPAWAETPVTICVPERASTQVLSTNAKGECPSKTISKTSVKYKAEALPGTAELEKLDKILPHVTFVESGIGGKPTIEFSGVNLQLVNGEGKTASTNGEGNLVIGYDENPKSAAQTGSHDLILGDEQEFTSYGGIDAGRLNSISGAFASVTGGVGNFASGGESSVSGGRVNVADEFAASISGGQNNVAGFIGSVSGGGQNKAAGGGGSNWVGGGFKNSASGGFSSVFGGKEVKAEKEFEALP